MPSDARRPTKEDVEALELLLNVEALDASSAQFIEDLATREEEGTFTGLSEKQATWFDSLCARFLS